MLNGQRMMPDKSHPVISVRREYNFSILGAICLKRERNKAELYRTEANPAKFPGPF